jgi:hypothetical protein
MHGSRKGGELNSAGVGALTERWARPAGAGTPTLARTGQDTARVVARLPSEFGRDARPGSRPRPVAPDRGKERR